jgi:AcrR family transcriptional regulator
MSGTSQHARRPAEDRRREIADAALRVIASQGLGRFTSIAIAREVGLTDAALFRHFPPKEAIVDAAIDRVEELLFEGFPPEDEDPIERLGSSFRRRVAVIRAYPAITALVATGELAKAGSAAGVKRATELRVRSIAFVRSCIEDAERRGLLAARVGAEEATIVVVGALLALALSRMHPDRESVVAGIAPRVWSALESFLRGRMVRSRSAGRRPPRGTGRHHPRGETP